MLNRPRYEALTWKVQLLNPELSTKSAFSVEGSRVDAEPSMIWGINVEGSVLENGTVREMGH